MAEETPQNRLAAAKKKLKEYWQRNSVPAEAKRNRKTNGSSPETSTSAGCHSPRDPATGIYGVGPTSCATLKDLESPCQEQAVVLDSRAIKISRLNNTIKSLEQQKKQVEHQLEEEKKANNKKQKAERELEVQIQRLNIQKKKLTIDLYHTKCSLRYFEEESKDLAGCLQHSSQRTEELERALSAVTATQKNKVDRSSKRSKTLLKTQLKQSLQERALLKAHVTQMKESLQQVQLERDEYAEHIKGERARWQERMRQMSQELWTLKKENQHNMHRVEELERSLSQFNNQMAEPLSPEPPAVAPEEELQHLRKELERVSAELQAQVENHQHVSLLNQAQKERLREQEERLRRQEERLQQLAEPQSGFEELNNENKSALHLEQQVEGLQEKLREVETVTSTHKEPEAAVSAPGTGGESVSGETPRALQEVMEKLERGLMDLLEEKADLRERVEKLEHQFIQYWRERCHQKIKHLITEPEGSAKEATPGGGHHQAGPGRRDEGGAPGAAGDAVAAWVDGNKGHSKFLAAAQNPADEPSPGAPPPQELGAADQHGDLCEVNLTDSSGPAQGEARKGSPHDNPTAQPIMQDHQEHPGLGSNRSGPFFCWAWLQRRRR
ncbi:golgin subfamily A member 8C-like isoform X3 [Piliocolobus tephrosceles]|uniref:golgin subfamily A member 8C-like isoform X3 n=1 Tax=Piliocolobus tephrosceles TaxID=591936 RepID=UPI000E6B497B|nr:golgin subfamily A member 8C-like isoform X3 [Piliocolobus tephrosceles]